MSKLEQSIGKLQKQLENMKGKSRLEVAATLKDMASKGIQKVAATGKKIAGKVWTVTLKAVDLVTSPFKKVLGLLSSPIAQAAAFAGITLGLGDTVHTFMDFEAAMSQVSAVSGASGTELEKLTEKAREMGATTKFTSTEAAEAFNYMAMAGWKTGDMLNGIDGVLNLAAASNEDLATTSDIVTDAMTAFGMKANEASHFADVLAAASSSANTNVGLMGETFKYVAPVAGAMGYSIEDSAIAIGLMANNGIKASQGGTALRSIISRLSTDAGASSKKLGALGTLTQKLGVQFYKADGSVRALNDVLIDSRSAWQGLSKQQQINYAKTIAGEEAMSGWLALMNAAPSDIEKVTAAIKNCDGVAKDMADTMMDNLKGSLTKLQSAVGGLKESFGGRLSPYVRGMVDWIALQIPAVENAIDDFMDTVDEKIAGLKTKFAEISAGPEWQNADFFGKVKIAWDEIIAQPFIEWWQTTGKEKIANAASDIGAGLGAGLKNGILALLGVDAGGAVADGVDIGKSFADGFLEGFDGEKVGKAIWQAIKGGTKSLISDAATLLPGGKEASGTSRLSAAVLGYGAFKAGKTGYKAYKGGKAIVNGAKAVRDVAGGVKIFNAAANGSHAAESALGMAQAGQLGASTSLGTTIAPAVNALAKATPFIAGVAATLQTGVDAYRGTQKAAEWTGSSSTGNKVASGVGAALGGTGSGILGNESAGKKALNIGGGALKGAGIGAAVGSVVPVVGTGVGAAVGAGIGAAGAAIGGSTIAKGLSAAGSAIGSFFTKTVPQAAVMVGQKLSGFFMETVPQKCGELLTGIEGFFTETVPYAIGYAAGKIQLFFTETIPQKWDELITGIGSFFTESIPNAITAVGEALAVFFTDTVPTFFTGLWNGITGFFTETIPNTLEAVGSSLNTFFTETVPNKVKEIWDSVLKFFTQTIPAAVANITEGVTGFVNGIKEKVTGFLGDIKDKVTGFFGNASDSLGAGYSSAIESTPHAEGGIMTRPHIGLVAEDGAEAIIPLSGKRRNRGISLWQEAGERLGVKPYAEGDFAGNTDYTVPAAASGSAMDSGTGINVTIQNVAFEINVNGGDLPDTQSLVELIKENIRNLTDEIAYQLAVSLQQVYANKPTIAWES